MLKTYSFTHLDQYWMEIVFLKFIGYAMMEQFCVHMCPCDIIFYCSLYL